MTIDDAFPVTGAEINDVQRAFALEGSVLAQDNTNLVEGYLKATDPDNTDRLINEAGWENVDDDDFGLRKRR